MELDAADAACPTLKSTSLSLFSHEYSLMSVKVCTFISTAKQSQGMFVSFDIFFEVVILMPILHVKLTLTPGTETKAPPAFHSKFMNTTGSSALLFSLSSVSAPVCRVSPANEGGDGRGGRVYLLTGHL